MAPRGLGYSRILLLLLELHLIDVRYTSTTGRFAGFGFVSVKKSLVVTMVSFKGLLNTGWHGVLIRVQPNRLASCQRGSREVFVSRARNKRQRSHALLDKTRLADESIQNKIRLVTLC